MLAVKKRTILIIIVITVGAFVLVYGIINLLTNAGDENIDKYSEVLRASLDENYHFILEEKVSHLDENAIQYDEYYRLGENNLRISTYSQEMVHLESHDMVYNDKNYTYSVHGDVIDAAIHSSVNPTDGIPDGINSTYYLINGANVTYEETEEQYIFTYENKGLIGRTVFSTYKEEVTDGYTSAVSVAYLDKDWNLQKLVINETWMAVDANGEEQERERIITITYYDTSDEEIQKVLEDECEMIKQALNSN